MDTDEEDTSDHADESLPVAGGSNQEQEEAVKSDVETKTEELDPLLADWFKIDEKPNPLNPNSGNASDTETENDSDNADVAPEEGDLDDDWFNVKPAISSDSYVDDGQKVSARFSSSQAIRSTRNATRRKSRT